MLKSTTRHLEGRFWGGRAHLSSCLFLLLRCRISLNLPKVLYGVTVKWSKNLFRQEANTGVFPIQSWLDFEQQFQSQFFLVNAESDAVNTLEGSSYYQGNRTVDDYLDSFLTLVSDTGYTDPRTLVVKFH